MSLENFTAYTELDANNRYVVTANKIAVTRVERGDVDQHVVFDYGVDFFDGDFTHQVKFTATESGGGDCYFWCLSNQLGEIFDISDGLYVRNASGSVLLLEEEYGGSIAQDFATGLTLGDPYWFTIVRDDAFGSFGLLQCFIYEDEAKTLLFDTLSITLHAKNDFRYVYGTIGTGGGTTAYLSGDVENLDLGLGVVSFNGFPFFFDPGHY